MNRIQHYARIAGRTLIRTPLPAWAYTSTFGKFRVPSPTTAVLKKHAVDIELVDRTRVVWLDRHKAANGVIVYLHGGGYVSGPFQGDWEWLSQQADARECAGLLIDYRYGPDYVHPTALDDATAVVRALLAEATIAAGTWVLAGHQSGAGLGVALVARLEAEGANAAPAGVVLMNPCLDLALTNLELTETESRDPVHERRLLQVSAEAYAGRASLDDPELSPVHGNLGFLGPTHVSVGSKDLFLTDTRILKLQLEQADVALTYREINGRISVAPRLRRGADMQRLMSEQRAFIERALG
ncbi:MAG: alpha/beta hydrolase fold domain-containing protein [Dermabacter sp.]|nr:alpha/beta hydrolase fold domain-containing protein [Dermabacter sp.]